MEKKKVFISTLGCSKNEVDSDVLAGQLKANQFDLIDSPTDSDIIIVNTCGFIESAKEESIDAILEAVELKKKDSNKKVLVAGCLSARYGDSLKADIPEVDAIFGAEDYQNILKNLDSKSVFDSESLYKKRTVSTDSHFAYIKISEGCNHSCNFCAIPSMRGKHRSRSIDDIVSEVSGLTEKGLKEAILIAQDSTYYGLDRYRKKKLADLLNELSGINGIEWVRLMYAYPLSFPMDAMELMANNSKICNYVDMPLQHVSDRMLSLMNRGTKQAYTTRILNQIRDINPDIAFRTTMIVGHPGETVADHQEMLEFIEEFKFRRLGVFTYSDEDGTPSVEMKNKVSMDVKMQRMNNVMDIQRDISLEANKRMQGKIVNVLIDSYNAEENQFIGRTEFDAPEIDNEVIVKYDQSINIGQMYPLFIKDVTDYELIAELQHA